MNLTRDSDSAFLNKPLKNSNKDKCFWGSHLFKTPREKRLHICATHSTFSHGSQSNHWITHEISLATTTFLYTDVTNWNSLPVHLKMLEFLSLFRCNTFYRVTDLKLSWWLALAILSFQVWISSSSKCNTIYRVTDFILSWWFALAILCFKVWI